MNGRNSPPRFLFLFVTAAALLSRGATAVEWREGTVHLSDGTEVSGSIGLTGDIVTVYNDAQKRQYRVRIAEIGRLDTAVEKQSLEEKWLFKEDGRDVKIYTGEKYPVRYYLTRLTFPDGRRLEGHVIGRTLYVKCEGQVHRFWLARKDEGKVGEKLDDLTYVKSIVFSDSAEVGTRGTIIVSLKLPPDEKLKEMHAINRKGEFIIKGLPSADGRRVRFDDCTVGKYDILVVTDKSLYLYLSREADKSCARLTDRSVAEVQAWVNKLRSFFHEQEIIYAAGNTKRLFALVRQERHGGTTLEGASLVRRYEVWIMHKPKEEWQIEKRLAVFRYVSPKPDLPRERIVVDSKLGGHEVTAEKSDLNLELKLAPTREIPIPKEKEDKGKDDG